MWKFWIIFSVFKFSFAAPVDTKEESRAVGQSGGLRCLLLASPFASCDDLKRYGNNIPKRLQELYDRVKKPFMNDEHLDSSSMELIPTSLLYLIPGIRLQNMTGHSAGNIVRGSPEDEALVNKLTNLLQTDEERRAFLEMLPVDLDSHEGRHLSQGVEKELGRAMTMWYPVGADWQYWQFDAALMAGSPVLAHLPSHFLNRMAHVVAEKFLFHIRNWRPDEPNTTTIWTNQPQTVKRMWTVTALKKFDRPRLWLPSIVKYSPYILIGATPDEISTIISYVPERNYILSLLQMDFSPLQARVFFDVVEQNYTSLVTPKTLKHLLPNLLPRQIQQFDAVETNVMDQLPEEFTGSLPTEAQVLQHYITHLVTKKKESNVSVGSWGNDISYLGKYVHLLPASVLETLENETLSIGTISKISSSSLTFRQLRYLTNQNQLLSFDRPETLLSAKHHLKALPAHLLNNKHVTEIPDNVQLHLLRNTPTESLALTAALMEKVQHDIHDPAYLRAILENENHDELLKLLSNRELMPQYRSLIEALSSIAKESETMAKKIRTLPSNIAGMLLAVFREDVASGEDGWTMDNLIENPPSPFLPLLLSSLQCRDMELVNDVDVVPILGHYVRERKALNLAFPKNMQYCCQKALTRYLKLKSQLREWDDESSGLLNLLELHEIRAVGGYILASLPMDVIQSSVLKNHIIREIGAMSLPELLTATSLSNLHFLATIYGKQFRDLHLRELADLGNLVWYLDIEEARKIHPNHLKLVLELREPGKSGVPCYTAAEREFWRELFTITLGKPESWTAGTISLLGDFLFVFVEEDFETISASARSEAADVLAKYTSLHNSVEWSGKLYPISYYEACVEALPIEERPTYSKSIRTLLRFYLESAHMLMKSVIPAETLLRLDNVIPDDVDDYENKGMEVDSAENNLDSRIKREVNGKRGRISKRVLNENILSSAENRKQELMANESRSLVVIFETKVDENNTRVEIEETFPRKSMEINCDAIRMLGMSASYVIDEDDIKKMTDVELEDCSEVLGSLNLPQNVRKAIWPRLKKWKESNNLLEVGNLVTAMEESDIESLQLDISKPWGLESLAVLSQHITNNDIITLIADRFLLSNPDVTSSIRYGSAAALGQIICQMPRRRQEKLLDQPGMFTRLTPLLGAPQLHLDDYCISRLVDMAKVAYGPPKHWSAEDISSLGVIASGLSKGDWHNSGMKADSLAGLSAAAVSRIPPEVFKEFSEEQLTRLPALSVAAISPAQSSSLSPSQSEVLERVRRQIPDKDLRAVRSSSSGLRPSVIGSLLLALTTVASYAL